MNLRIEPSEKYLLIAIDGNQINQEAIDQLTIYISNSDNENYVIVDLSVVTEIDKEMLLAFESQLQQIMNSDGSIIFVGNDEKINSAIEATFNNADIFIIHDVDEAIDFVLMNDIENEIGGEG